MLLPKRWVVERTFAWLGRCRLLNREYERGTDGSKINIYVAVTHLVLRRLCPRPRDGLPGCEAGGRGGATAGAEAGGECRSVPRQPVDLHADGGVGVGPAGGGVGGSVGEPRGVTPGGGRRTRISGGRSAANCPGRKFGPLCGRLKPMR